MKPKLTAKRPNGKEEFTSHHIACKALVMFKEHFEEMACSDFSLVFEGEEVRCHRVVLSGVSPVLAAMVRNEHQEVAEARAFIQVPAAVGKAFVR